MDFLAKNIQLFRKKDDPVLLWSPDNSQQKTSEEKLVLEDYLSSHTFRTSIQTAKEDSETVYVGSIEPRYGWQNNEKPTVDDLDRLQKLDQALKTIPNLKVFRRDKFPERYRTSENPLLSFCSKVPVLSCRDRMICMVNKQAFGDTIQPMFRKIKKTGHEVSCLDIGPKHNKMYGLIIGDGKYCPLLNSFKIYSCDGPMGSSFWFFSKKNRNNYLEYLTKK